MNIRMQLIRAGAALAIIGSVAAAESLSPTTTDVDCPFAKVAKPQRILLLDPIQKHPTWIDARQGIAGRWRLCKARSIRSTTIWRTGHRRLRSEHNGRPTR